ncbi:MAG: deoxyguanosinetriphosphate triphosphohydrolase [Blautia sp.]
MNWNQLLSEQRTVPYTSDRKEKSTDLRSEFEKDYHRIIGSASFRRLQDKTQVFALDKSDFIRTRLTHSLEVSSFAKSLGQNISQYLLQTGRDPSFTLQNKEDICSILQCAGLVHDIGNPPFGHFGEEAIRDWFTHRLPHMDYRGIPVDEFLSGQMLQDLYHFEGNAQALRQVGKLHFLSNEYGMNLTCGLLGAIIKYPVSSLEMDGESLDVKKRKLGYFYGERQLYRQICQATWTDGNRNPLAFILEAADDIAYLTADLEDSFKKGFVSYDNLVRELERSWERVGRTGVDGLGMLRRQYENAKKRQAQDPQLYAVQNWIVRLQRELILDVTDSFIARYEEIMAGTCQTDLFAGTKSQWLVEVLGEIACRYAFHSPHILKMEVSAWTILNFLMDKFVPAALYYDTEIPMDMMGGKLMSLISENYKQTYHVYSSGCAEKERLYLRLLLITDFISGMTDSYAKDLYQKLNGIS